MEATPRTMETEGSVVDFFVTEQTNATLPAARPKSWATRTNFINMWPRTISLHPSADIRPNPFEKLNRTKLKL